MALEVNSKVEELLWLSIWVTERNKNDLLNFMALLLPEIHRDINRISGGTDVILRRAAIFVAILLFMALACSWNDFPGNIKHVSLSLLEPRFHDRRCSFIKRSEALSKPLSSCRVSDTVINDDSRNPPSRTTVFASVEVDINGPVLVKCFVSCM